MKPTTLPAASMPELLAQATIASPLGPVLLACTARGLYGLWFKGQKDDPGELACPANAEHPILAATAQQMSEYWAGRRRRFDLPLDLHGTPFQQAVWQALVDIPFGATQSYGEIAKQIARPDAVRAVGTAVGRNPVSVIVPCHRVIGRDRSLTGYAGGLARKRHLLGLEGVAYVDRGREPRALDNGCGPRVAA